MKSSKYNVSVIIIICIILLYLVKQNYTYYVDIDKPFLYHVLKPGNYTGTSIYSPTEKYPNGLNGKHKASIHIIQNGLEVTNESIYSDSITGKHEYNTVRTVIYIYLPAHKNQLFKILHSYKDNVMVGCSLGYAIDKNEDSITFQMATFSHTSSKDYPKHIITLTRVNDNTLEVTDVIPTMIGLFHTFRMNATYTMVSN